MSKIIAISGIDGSGKSTCANLIKEYLNSKGISAVIIDAMKEGIVLTELKNLINCNNAELRTALSPGTYNLCWIAELLYNFAQKVQKHIDSGEFVILHRTELCCRVYSRLFDPICDATDRILNCVNLNYDIHIFLQISPEEAYKRILLRSTDGITDKEMLDLLKEASKLYSMYLSTSCYSDTVLIESNCSFEHLASQVQTIMTRYKL